MKSFKVCFSKWGNLCRYAWVLAASLEAQVLRSDNSAGPYKLNPFDPYSLKVPGFNPRAYQVKKRFLEPIKFKTGFKVCLLKCNVYPATTRRWRATARRSAGRCGCGC
jgi:hypothetical protein